MPMMAIELYFLIVMSTRHLACTQINFMESLDGIVCMCVCGCRDNLQASFAFDHFEMSIWPFFCSGSKCDIKPMCRPFEYACCHLVLADVTLSVAESAYASIVVAISSTWWQNQLRIWITQIERHRAED